MTKLRAIVVGSGWGAHAANALATDARAELRAVVGRGSERSIRLAEAVGVEFCDDLRRAISQHAPDFAVLAAGERDHGELAVRLLEGGANVLCAHPVAPGAAAVLDILAVAARHRRLVRTDYTFRIRPELRALSSRSGRGQLLRVAIEAPGRWLPIALDSAVVLAGPVGRVAACGTLPDPLKERAERTPQAFPPALQLEHRSGVVSSVVSFPHAWPGAPVRIAASFEAMRVEVMLPMGGARSVACLHGGAVREQEIVAPSARPEDPSVHARAMQDLVGAFIGAVAGEHDDLATLEDEAHLRCVWSTLWRAARERRPLDVEPPGPSDPRPTA